MLDPTIIARGFSPAHAAAGLKLARWILSCAVLAIFALEPAQAQTPAQPQSPAAVSPPVTVSPPVAPSATEAVPPPAASSPGLFEEFGRVLRDSTSIFTLPSPRETIDGFNARAKGATDTLGRYTRPNVASGRVVCLVAPNGAPDCKAAADKLCQSKGFGGGNSIESDAAESCPAKVLLSGRSPEPGECRTDNYVTRALCQ